LKKVFSLFNKTSCPNEEVNRTGPSPFSKVSLVRGVNIYKVATDALISLIESLSLVKDFAPDNDLHFFTQHKKTQRLLLNSGRTFEEFSVKKLAFKITM